MIKIEKGVVLLEGDILQLQTEVAVLLIGIYEKMIEMGEPKKLARKMILRLFKIFDKYKESYFED